MKRGSLSRSVALPAESAEAGHCPDGLRESDIDALLAETGLDFDLATEDDGAEQIAPVISLPTKESAIRSADPNGSEAA